MEGSEVNPNAYDKKEKGRENTNCKFKVPVQRLWSCLEVHGGADTLRNMSSLPTKSENEGNVGFEHAMLLRSHEISAPMFRSFMVGLPGM